MVHVHPRAASSCRVALRTAVLLAYACVVLAGCAMAPSIAAPRVGVKAVSLDRLEGADAYFTVQVDLDNPNARALAVDALDATLAIEGEPVAHATLVAPVVLPASGSASATLSARTGIDAVLRATAAAMRRGAGRGGGGLPALRYTVDGAAVVSGLRIPFSRGGELGGARP
jgi:hypothetical protein